MTYKELMSGFKKAFETRQDKLTYITLGYDDNRCFRHFQIPYTEENKKAWLHILRQCYDTKQKADKALKGWIKKSYTPTIYIGRTGNRKEHTYIVAIGTYTAEAGYFHMFSDGCYYDGERSDFETHEECDVFSHKLMEEVLALLNNQPIAH